MSDYNSRLQQLRDKIDEADDLICRNLLLRLHIIQEVGALKKEHGITEMSESRREEIMERLKEWAINNGFPSYVIADIYKILFDHSILSQQIIFLKNESNS